MFLMILINVLQVIIKVFKERSKKYSIIQSVLISTGKERRLKNILIVVVSLKTLQTVSKVPLHV